MARLIKLHEIVVTENPERDNEIYINVERIVAIGPSGTKNYPQTRVYASPGLFTVRESVEEVRSLVNSNREKINKYND